MDKEEKDCNITKLLISSTDSNPEDELYFSDCYSQPLKFATIADALSLSDYSFTMHSLPPDHISHNTRNVAFLSLQASTRQAFFYEENINQEETTYQITYDDMLMNVLPSYITLQGLPRFHLFDGLPIEVQEKIFDMGKKRNKGWRIPTITLPSWLVNNVFFQNALPVLVVAVGWGINRCVRSRLNMRYDYDDYERQSALYSPGRFSVYYYDEEADGVCRHVSIESSKAPQRGKQVRKTLEERSVASGYSSAPVAAFY